MAFFHDLGLVISTWQVAGDQHIILMANMNGDIWKEEISSFGISLGLQESILSAHPTLPHQLLLSKATRRVNHPLMEAGCLLISMPLQYPFVPSP